MSLGKDFWKSQCLKSLKMSKVILARGEESTLGGGDKHEQNHGGKVANMKKDKEQD
jgi:hypothetical protein